MPGEIDLNVDIVLYDQENEVHGVNPSEPMVSVGVNDDQTLNEPFNGKARDVDGDNESVKSLYGLATGGLNKSMGSGIVVDRMGNDCANRENEFMDKGNYVEPDFGFLDSGYNLNFKTDDFEDGKKRIEGSKGGPIVIRDVENAQGLILELNDDVQNVGSLSANSLCFERNMQENEDARESTENNSIRMELNMESEVRDELTARKWDQNGKMFLVDEISNQVAGDTVNLSKAMEYKNKIGTADVLSSTHGDVEPCAFAIAEDQNTSNHVPEVEISNTEKNGTMEVDAQAEVRKNQITDIDIPEAGTVKVANIDGISHHEGPKVRNHVREVDTSDGEKYVTMKADAQAEVGKNQVKGSHIQEAGTVKDIGNASNVFNIVVDLKPYISMNGVDMGRKSVTSELEFCVSDLVWGKVRGHPWWPGQIFEPSAASGKAKKYFKNDSYLIAYFGDQSFAWNNATKIKPFQVHFSQMEKQSNFEDFQHAVDCALDEVSRRVEFGLACSCMPGEVYAKLKTQIVTNAGIREESSRRDGGDRFLSSGSFEPMKLVNYLKSLSISPYDVTDRLEFVIAQTQLMAFYRSKGHSQLPEVQMLGGLFENGVEILFTKEKHNGEVIDDVSPDFRDGDQVHYGKGRKRKPISGISSQPSKKEKSLSDLLSGSDLCIPNGEHTSKGETGSKLMPHFSGRKRKAIDVVSDDSSLRHNEGHLSTGTTMSLQMKQTLNIGDRITRAASQLNDSSPLLNYSNRVSQKAASKDTHKKKSSCKSQSKKLIQLEPSSPDEILLKLCLAARDPMGEYSFSNAMIHLLSGFRNSISLEVSSLREQELYVEQTFGGENGEKPTKEVVASEAEFLKDSYWTDRIIQSIPEGKPFMDNQNGIGEYLHGIPGSPSFSPQVVAELGTELDPVQQLDDGNLELQALKPVIHSEESCMEDVYPTALILKFTSLDSIPSETNLNKIFGRFGPLIESKTEILKKSSRARVFFKRRFDAETAFSSAGKYSIFGPSLVSYSLKYMPSTAKSGRKSGTTQEGS
ncbi:Serine/threonine-protein kinase ATM [Quillaja saponaria]|uniref:Serine/threonine-protein kinase ATM n=1 Tax=Quillaja saponaria TaxID=32244 RepID=A0AAD7Q9R4_QUISA|nr:Serine/threonine-protein kinase ATM [Quillaja saponaria]